MTIAAMIYLALFTATMGAIVVLLGNELFVRWRSRRGGKT